MMQTTEENLSKSNNIKHTAMTEQQVLIAGGGHVGLSFALLLANQGIASTLLEKNSYPIISPNDDSQRSHYLDSRNTALSRRTVQIYQEIGLWDELQSHACRIDAVQISEQGSFGRAQLNKKDEQVESFGQVMENAWLGRKLLLAALQEPLITLIDNADVIAVDQKSDSVTLSFSYYGEEEHEQQLQGSVLVACDGRDSTVRQLLDIGTTTYDYKQTAIVGVVETDKPHEHNQWLLLSSKEQLTPKPRIFHHLSKRLNLFILFIELRASKATLFTNLYGINTAGMAL